MPPLGARPDAVRQARATLAVAAGTGGGLGGRCLICQQSRGERFDDYPFETEYVMEVNDVGPQIPGLATVGRSTRGRGPGWRSQLLARQRLTLNPPPTGASVNSYSFHRAPSGRGTESCHRHRECFQPRNLGQVQG